MSVCESECVCVCVHVCACVSVCACARVLIFSHLCCKTRNTEEEQLVQ